MSYANYGTLIIHILCTPIVSSADYGATTILNTIMCKFLLFLYRILFQTIMTFTNYLRYKTQHHLSNNIYEDRIVLHRSADKHLYCSVSVSASSPLSYSHSSSAIFLLPSAASDSHPLSCNRQFPLSVLSPPSSPCPNRGSFRLVLSPLSPFRPAAPTLDCRQKGSEVSSHFHTPTFISSVCLSTCLFSFQHFTQLIPFQRAPKRRSSARLPLFLLAAPSYIFPRYSREVHTSIRYTLDFSICSQLLFGLPFSCWWSRTNCNSTASSVSSPSIMIFFSKLNQLLCSTIHVFNKIHTHLFHVD